MFSQFKNWYQNRHDYAKNWKARTGGKVMGCFCSYVPEEILVAGGILPVRVLGSHEPQNVTEPYLFGMFCPFCRDVLAQGLQKRYDYLDGITLAQSCIHLRQSYVGWREHVEPKIPFDYYIYMPNKLQTAAAAPYTKSEFEKYRQSIEKLIGRKISEADLERGIAALNRNRDLMHQVYVFRKRDDPPLTGLEAMYMTVSSTWVDKDEHSAEIEKVLKQLPERKLSRNTGSRLLIVGSEDDDTAFVEMVEKLGATVAVDDHCTGTRYYWNKVQPNDDPMRAIADRYVKRPPCPTKDWEERWRFPHILQLCKDFKVQGAVIIQQKFCDPHECDIMPLRQYLDQHGIPSLFLEFDVTVPLGQFRIRVEAFLEMIGAEELF